MFDDEDSFNDLVNNADFDLDSAEPIEKRPKVTWSARNVNEIDACYIF